MRARAQGVTAGVLSEHHTVLRIAGSRVIGRMLMPQLLMRYLSERGDSQVRVRPGQPPWDVVVSGVRASGGTEVIAVRFANADKAIAELRAGRVDLVMMLRALTASERAAVLAPKSEGAGDFVTVSLGKVGGAVLVNRRNPIRSLTGEQIAAIFSGRIRDWSQVGGPRGPIDVYIADHPDVDAVLFDTLGASAGTSGTAVARSPFPPFAWPVRPASESALAHSVEADAGGITFMLQPFPNTLKVLSVQAPTQVNYYPSPDAISSGDYAFRAHLYLSGVLNRRVSALETFLQSLTQTRRTVAAILAGLEPPCVSLLAQRPRPGLPQIYQDAVANGLRISQTIHFSDAAGTVTPRLAKRLDRIARFLSRIGLTRGRARLLAFTNPQGDPAQSARHAFALGQIVKRELERRGILGAEVYGFGDIMPLAPGVSTKLRTLNRRVEIWAVP
ncbi:MAG: substrate-binding domain-containing protein [Alphaproteobacteria bacterium]|nr:substrate-binding domain-containing protein [Alphaproteobacteria bacterium]